MEWSQLIGEYAMGIVEVYERTQGRMPERVHRKGVGYDVLSKDADHERFIEVKGISESWETYNWQPLHKTEVEALDKNIDKFFLYIIHFEIKRENRNEENLRAAEYNLFIIPGTSLRNNEFRIEPASFALRPISKTRLKKYEVPDIGTKDLKTCLCNEPLCAKCLTVSCKDKNCITHTQKNKDQWKRRREGTNADNSVVHNQSRT